MIKSNSDLNIISISLPSKTVKKMEETANEMGYMSRSELVRDALRKFLKEKTNIDLVKGVIEGVITLLYDHHNNAKISSIRHQHTKIFRSFMHSDFNIDECSCCEVLLFSGDADEVRRAFFELKSVKGVEEADIFIASR